jgi:glyoxylase-like metal-dependent hydrolase (beta-lactamase superfamily II)
MRTAYPVTLVAPDLWRITTPLPFRPREVHAYLARVEDGRFLLVDGGANTEDAWRALDGGVREVAGGWGRVALHLVTHMHLDHVGLVQKVREASGASLLMGALDAERAAHAEAHPEEEEAYRTALVCLAGAPEELRRAVEEARAESSPLSAYLAVDRTLTGEGDDLPDAPGWRWIWTPGHTAGHLSLHRPGDGVAVGGDAVLPRVTPTIGVNRQREDPVADYLAALERLDGLDLQLLLPGHGEPLRPPRSRIQELLDATREETRTVAGWVRGGATTAWEVARLRHPRPDYPPAILLHAVRETIAHLRHGVRTGTLHEDLSRDGVARFRASNVYSASAEG